MPAQKADSSTGSPAGGPDAALRGGMELADRPTAWGPDPARAQSQHPQAGISVRRRTLLYLAREGPLPVGGAAQLRTYNWLVHLSSCFDITFLAASSEKPAPYAIEALAGYCKQVLWTATERPFWRRATAELRYLCTGRPAEDFHRRFGAARRALEHLQHGHFDVALVDHWTWLDLAQRVAKFTVLDTGDLHAERHAAELRDTRQPLRRLLRPWLERRFEAHEAASLAQAGLVLVPDESRRQRILSRSRNSQVFTLPAGVEANHYFAPAPVRRQRRMIVFYTSLESVTQRDALNHLRYDILPEVRRRCGRVCLLVASRVSSPELEALLGADPLAMHVAPEDVRPVLSRATLAVLPLRLGSGSQSRLAQLLALGVPIVATPAAMRPLDVRSGEGALMATSPAEFARRVQQVILDPSLQEDLSRRGRELAERRLSLEATYGRVVEQLASESFPTPDQSELLRG